MNDNKKAKIVRFMQDKEMNEAIYDVLLDSFLSKSSNDVYVLAASRLSVDFLKQGWKDLERFDTKKTDESPPLKQVGL